jgi:hypothetical protein
MAKRVARMFRVWAPRTEVRLKQIGLSGFIGRACITDDMVVNYDVTYWYEGVLKSVTVSEYTFDVSPGSKQFGLRMETP